MTLADAWYHLGLCRVKIHYNSSLASWDLEKRHVTFAGPSGGDSAALEYDLLVGCDGRR